VSTVAEQDGNAELLVHPARGAAAAEALAKDLDALHDPHAKAADKAAAAERLGSSSGGDAAVHALLGALHHVSPQVRGAAAFAPGARRPARRRTARHPAEDPDVRCRAAVALA
jgi:hypothetical protein